MRIKMQNWFHIGSSLLLSSSLALTSIAVGQGESEGATGGSEAGTTQGTSPKSTESSTMGQHQASQQEHRQVVVIDFQKGQATLSEESKKKIQDQMKSALGNIETLRVAVWSDREFDPNQELSEDAQQLTEKRIENLKSYLEDQLKVKGDVETYNMAEKPGVIARTFKTEEAELKSIFAKKGGEPGATEAEKTGKNAELYIFRDQGGPAKAVLVATVKSSGTQQHQEEPGMMTP